MQEGDRGCFQCCQTHCLVTLLPCCWSSAALFPMLLPWMEHHTSNCLSSAQPVVQVAAFQAAVSTTHQDTSHTTHHSLEHLRTSLLLSVPTTSTDHNHNQAMVVAQHHSRTPLIATAPALAWQCQASTWASQKPDQTHARGSCDAQQPHDAERWQRGLRLRPQSHHACGCAS